MIPKDAAPERASAQRPAWNRRGSGLGLLPVFGSYLAVLVAAFWSVFFSLRSSLLGLHFSQDLPSL